MASQEICTKNNVAVNVLKGMKIIGSNFDVAWEKLCRRYDNPRVCLSAHLEALISVSVRSQSFVGYRRGGHSGIARPELSYRELGLVVCSSDRTQIRPGDQRRLGDIARNILCISVFQAAD
jgi:hypothetical protein